MLIPKARENEEGICQSRGSRSSPSPSCTDCIPVEKEGKWGDRNEEKKGGNTTTSTQARAAGREAAAEEGQARGASKAGLSYPQLPEVCV